MNRRILPILLALCLAALAAGCAKGNLATPEQDAQARLRNPVPDKAVIYLLRDLGDLYITEVEVGARRQDPWAPPRPIPSTAGKCPPDST